MGLQIARIVDKSAETACSRLPDPATRFSPAAGTVDRERLRYSAANHVDPFALSQP